MARYASAGGGDDAQLEMGDRGFVRLVQRLEPDQLGDGELTESRNFRLERRAAQVRKAIRNISGVLEQDGDPLRIPFWLVDTPGGESILAASRTDDVVTLTVDHGFPSGGPAWLKMPNA